MLSVSIVYSFISGSKILLTMNTLTTAGRRMLHSVSQGVPVTITRQMSGQGKLGGKVALVTASTEGIGYGIAQNLASHGASVMICSRKVTSLSVNLGYIHLNLYVDSGC